MFFNSIEEAVKSLASFLLERIYPKNCAAAPSVIPEYSSGIQGLKRLISLLLERIYPKNCAVCEKEGAWLCANCVLLIPNVGQNICLFCNQEAKNGICFNCKENGLNGFWAASSYKYEPISKLIKAYKFNFVKSIAKDFGKLLIKYYEENLLNLSKNFILVPIPLSKERLAWRGFNQSQLLAEELANKYNLKICNNLVRIKNTKAQSLLSAEERISNLQDTFAWTSSEPAKGVYLLIDDVATTGQTLFSAAKILKKAGAREVYALTIAKD